jgi:hypothetical protein
VEFTAGDAFIVTAGGRDRCVFQWTLDTLPVDTSALVRAGAPGSTADGEEEDDDADSIDEEMKTTDAQLLRDVSVASSVFATSMCACARACMRDGGRGRGGGGTATVVYGSGD